MIVGAIVFFAYSQQGFAKPKKSSKLIAREMIGKTENQIQFEPDVHAGAINRSEESPNFYFQFAGYKSFKFLVIQKAPDMKILDSIPVSIIPNEMFSYGDDAYCYYEETVVPAIFASIKLGSRSKFHPKSAWRFDLEKGKIIKLNPSSVLCTPTGTP